MKYRYLATKPDLEGEAKGPPLEPLALAIGTRTFNLG